MKAANQRQLFFCEKVYLWLHGVREQSSFYYAKQPKS